MRFFPRKFWLWLLVGYLIMGAGIAVACDSHKGPCPNVNADAKSIDTAGPNDADEQSTPAFSNSKSGEIVSDEKVPFVDQVVEHPFGDDEELLRDFSDLMVSPPVFPPIILMSSPPGYGCDCDDNCGDDCDCDCHGCGCDENCTCDCDCGCHDCDCDENCGCDCDCSCHDCGCDGNCTFDCDCDCHDQDCGCNLKCPCDCDCDCGCSTKNHAYKPSSFGSGSSSPSTSVSITSPIARPLKIKINTTHGFTASPDFKPNFSIPENWGFNKTLENTATWTWNGANKDDNNPFSASKKFTASGTGQEVSVTYKHTVKNEYIATRTCQKCSHVDSKTETLTATGNANASLSVNVHTLKLEVKPQAGNEAWDTSATIGAGGVDSKAHKADVRAKLDPEDSDLSFYFSVASKSKDGDWGVPWDILADGKKLYPLTSTTLIDGSVTWGGQEEGADSSVSVDYAHAFEPLPTLEPQSDGSLEGIVNVVKDEDDTNGLDGHEIVVVPVSVTIQRWDSVLEKLVTETRTANLPPTLKCEKWTDEDGLAELKIHYPNPYDRILSATFRVYDKTVWKDVSPPPEEDL